jgi:hypothetical protein
MDLRLTNVGTATLLVELGGLRLLTDPALDPAGTAYRSAPCLGSEKTEAPALPQGGLGRLDALGRRESRVYEEMINQGRVSFLSAPLEGMLEGGVPVLVDGQCVGAVGVSGVKSTEDAQIARAGIAALGA